LAAPRLNTDPNLQICPDFGADEFALYRNALAAALNVTAEQAVENLAASWAIQNTTQKATWALQLEADAAIRRARDQEAEDAAAAIQAQADREADDALKILERKRPKMHTFNPLKSVGADILY
jgi:low affinity Fe/Cu permease